MRLIAGVLVVLCAVLSAGCTIHEDGQPFGVGASEQTRSPRLVPGESDPCGLLERPQRDRLGVGEGKFVEDPPLKDAAFCVWRSRKLSADRFQGAVLPNSYSLANIRRSYESPRDFIVAGLPAVSGSIGGLSGELSCWVFAELPDGRLADASFWAGSSEGMSHAAACERASNVLEMIVDTVQSR
ncbi:DUF3558 family protein [Pseudonocardia sp. N23]|uniref:DUF3558 family protein n=1 Tax=Pseudonocardia sp. N23 TaxID=1987376 RepID=UPI000BFE7689|nr:DUF3558 family protein [Pseudonocardia sp. N23]